MSYLSQQDSPRLVGTKTLHWQTTALQRLTTPGARKGDRKARLSTARVAAVAGELATARDARKGVRKARLSSTRVAGVAAGLPSNQEAKQRGQGGTSTF